MSKLGTLGKRDFINGLFIAIGSAVLTALVTIFNQAGFNIFEADWYTVINNVITVSLIATSTYLSKNLLTNRPGELFKPDVE